MRGTSSVSSTSQLGVMQSVYEYAFLFCREKGHKCVQKEVALEMWKLLFKQRHWPLGQSWIEYVDEHHHRAISKDTWLQLFDFFQARASLDVLEVFASTSSPGSICHI